MELPFKQRWRQYLTTKTSGYIWRLIDDLACKLTRFATYYETSIGNEYAKEYARLNITEKKHILHIGCGSYPLTAIILAKNNDAHSIVGIDNDTRAVTAAHTIITNKHLTDRIKIEHHTGQEYPLKTYDMIIVSSCSWPKLDIVDHVLTHAKKNCIIILRELNHISGPIDKRIRTNPNIKIMKQVEHHPFPFLGPFGWRSYYLIKT
ncbi:MAG: nicotianamine synthase family protein [Methanobacteriota archaeon]